MAPPQQASEPPDLQMSSPRRCYPPWDHACFLPSLLVTAFISGSSQLAQHLIREPFPAVTTRCGRTPIFPKDFNHLLLEDSFPLRPPDFDLS